MTGTHYTASELTNAFPPVTPAKRAPKKAADPKPAQHGEPPIVGILRALGMTVAPAKDLGDGTGYRTTCPWVSSHSDAVNDESGLLTVWPDGEPRHYLCRHSHCADRTIADLLSLARERGLEVPETRKRSHRPTILVAPPENEVADAGREALANVPGVYARRGSLVHVHRHSAGTEGKRSIPTGFTSIKNASAPWTRERLSEAATWERAVKVKEECKRVPSLVPEWVAAMILEDPGHQLAELRAVTATPVFLSDGSIHAESGKLREGVLYIGPSDSYTVADSPTLADAKAAVGRLLALVADFPWAKAPSQEAHRAAWIASLLTVAGRYGFDGCTPWVLMEANNPGSGKGLLSQLTSIITTGVEAPVLTCPSDEAELRKSILPVLVDATRMQVLDEIHPGFGGREWNAMVTATSYKGRILGTSQTVEVPNDTIWFCTGNNVSLAAETTRRTLYIRLEPMEEHPEDRDDFKIADLLGHARQHQVELLSDALTILRAFHVAGRPAAGLKPWGSFEGWTRLIRDAVYWCTGTNCDCRVALASMADTGRLIHEELVHELHAAFGLGTFTTGTVIEKTITRPNLLAALEAACPSKDGKLHAVGIGKRFASFRRRPVAGMILDQSPTDDRNGGKLWCIARLEAAPLKTGAAEDWQAIG